jgi:hypothetical protein
MGPIEGSQFTFGQLNTLLDNEKFVKEITSILSMDDLSGFTAKGRDPMNIATSQSRLRSTTGNYLGAAENRTPASLSKEVMMRRNENAILRAAMELARPVETPPPPTVAPPSRTVLPALARGLNPILAFLELLTHSTSLNTGEKEWLRKRDAEEMEVRNRQRLAEELKALQQNANPIIKQVPTPPGGDRSTIRQVPQQPQKPIITL